MSEKGRSETISLFKLAGPAISYVSFFFFFCSILLVFTRSIQQVSQNLKKHVSSFWDLCVSFYPANMGSGTHQLNKRIALQHIIPAKHSELFTQLRSRLQARCFCNTSLTSCSGGLHSRVCARCTYTRSSLKESHQQHSS